MQNETAHVTKEPSQVTQTFGLDQAQLLGLVAPYFAALAQARSAPFIELLIRTLGDLANDLPAEAQPASMALARQLLANDAIRLLQDQDRQNQTFLQWLTELPDQIEKRFIGNITKSAEEWWQVLQPHFKTELIAQTAPLIESVTLMTKFKGEPWSNMPFGLSRLQKALEVTESRSEPFLSQERPELWVWLTKWVNELISAWNEVLTGDEFLSDELSTQQLSKLRRILSAAYTPKCPSPSLPPSHDFCKAVFIPLYTESVSALSALDTHLRTMLELVPILPKLNQPFDAQRMDAPSMYRRSAQSSEDRPGTVFDVRDVGVERHGKAIIKSTVGIIEARPKQGSDEPARVPPRNSQADRPTPIRPDVLLNENSLPAHVQRPIVRPPNQSINMPAVDDDEGMGLG